MHAPADEIAKYKGRYVDGWDALRSSRHRRQIALGLVEPQWALPPRDPAVPAWSGVKDKDWEAHRMAVYAAMIDRMDQGIGKLMARLHETGADQNTLVLFLSDNGGCAEGSGRSAANRPNPPYVPMHTRDGRRVRRGNAPEIVPGPPDTYSTYGRSWAHASNTPFRSYKHWTHEGGIATPFIAHWPAGVTARGITSQVGHVIDVMATCLDIAGAAHPRQYRGHDILAVEGRSLAPIFRGEAAAQREDLFWEHEGNRAVLRQGRWKLVANHDAPWELYDLHADRTELKNLAERNPAMVRELSGSYEAWAKRVGVVPWKEYQAKLSQFQN
jgi:arylsulfatase